MSSVFSYITCLEHHIMCCSSSSCMHPASTLLCSASLPPHQLPQGNQPSSSLCSACPAQYGNCSLLTRGLGGLLSLLQPQKGSITNWWPFLSWHHRTYTFAKAHCFFSQVNQSRPMYSETMRKNVFLEHWRMQTCSRRYSKKSVNLKTSTRPL